MEGEEPERDLDINGTIAEESWFDDEITPEMFRQELFSSRGRINLWINSPGGDCIAASRIYSMLMDYPDEVIVIIDGIAASAASPLHMMLNPGQSFDQDFPHDGEEFGYVLKGEILLTIGKRKIKVKKGESFYFTANKVHQITNKASTPAEFIWVSSPPSF